MPHESPSKVEIAKKESHCLRGGLLQTLRSQDDHFEPADLQVLKFHGSYQQDDRDLRQARYREGTGRAYQFMVRLVLPGGSLTAPQYLALDRMSDVYGNGTLRITTRQGFQMHGVLKDDLRGVIREVHQELLTTLGACGDVERNVMACPAPLNDEAHRTAQDVARAVALALRPATRAYHEIWIDGEKRICSRGEEPFYGDDYLPRKFKTAISLQNDDCVEVLSCDAGLIGILEGGRISAFQLVAGGGMGMTHNKPHTFAALAQPIGTVAVEDAVEAVRTMAAIFRDNGNRSDRRQARLKYLLRDWGLQRFRQEFRARTPIVLGPPRELPAPGIHDHLGAHPQGDGKSFCGIWVQMGRIADRPGHPLKTVLRSIIRDFQPRIRTTPQQSLLLTGLDESELGAILDRLKEAGIAPVEELSPTFRHAMACPALPTCGLALGESERLLPRVLTLLEKELEDLGIGDVPLTVRMTGCPNGCARPYSADLAFVARSPSRYNVFVGGGLRADRLADLFAADLTTDDFLPTLRPLLERWSSERRPEEGLGDFYQRSMGASSPRLRLSGQEKPSSEDLFSEVVL